MSLPQFLNLITSGWKTGKDHRIEIWFVEYNEKFYVISEHLEQAHWVQNITHNPRIKFSIYDEVLEGIARILDQTKDSVLVNTVSELMSQKYKWNQGLIVEITPSRVSKPST